MDIASNGKKDMLNKINESFAKESGVAAAEVTTADVTSTAPVTDAIIDEYMDKMQDKPVASQYVGVVEYGKFTGALYESLTMSDDSADRAVRVAIVKVPTNNHSSVVAWQISKACNDELLAHDANQDAEDDDAPEEEALSHGSEEEEDE